MAKNNINRRQSRLGIWRRCKVVSEVISSKIYDILSHRKIDFSIAEVTFSFNSAFRIVDIVFHNDRKVFHKVYKGDIYGHPFLLKRLERFRIVRAFIFLIFLEYRYYFSTNLYPTPRTDKKYFGCLGSFSKYFLKDKMKLSIVRVEGYTS